MMEDTSRVSLSLSVYLVVFIDLLGQSAELDQVRQMPTTNDEQKAARYALNKSAGPVRSLDSPSRRYNFSRSRQQ